MMITMSRWLLGPRVGLWVGMLALWAGSAMAADKTAALLPPAATASQPALMFSADALRIDDKRKVRVLSGRVEIIRGGMQIHAGEVELRTTPQGEQVLALGQDGTPARFEQKREGRESLEGDERVEGQALRVEYDAKSGTVKLSGQAVLRRWRGTVLADEMAGHTIAYDHEREVWEVLGAAPAGGVKGRVRGLVSPAPSSAPASAPQGERR
ncbi:MAG: lipopolysaccharide transport periplasmic protein LptA [Leptothrix ochracea]|uniref:lipopolysaccharide transport periplasmic protein LptA n=2 Tax=Leptothrix ochracea TaxID=735331 RepID=UPI0034E2F716